VRFVGARRSAASKALPIEFRDQLPLPLTKEVRLDVRPNNWRPKGCRFTGVCGERTDELSSTIAPIETAVRSPGFRALFLPAYPPSRAPLRDQAQRLLLMELVVIMRSRHYTAAGGADGR